MQFDHAGLGIDLDLADVAAVGKGGRVRAHRWRSRYRPGSMPFGRRAGWNAAIATCFSVTLRSVPATLNFASANSMSATAASSMCAASFLPFSMTLSAASDQRRCRRVTIDRDPFEPMPNATRSVSPSMNCTSARIDAELLVQDLLERGLVPLAVRLGSHQQHRAAAGVEADLGIFRHRTGRLLDRVGQADAAQLAARARCRLPRGEAGIVRGLQRDLHVPGELAAIVDRAPAAPCTASLRLDDIAPAQLDRIDPDFASRGLDDRVR